MTSRIVAVAMLSFVCVRADAADKPAGSNADSLSLAKTIDRLIEEKLKSQGVPPAPLASDATFFRRVHLTLGGRIPTASEVRTFLDDKDPDKRTKVIDALLNSAAFANHLSITWSNWLLPEAATNPDLAGLAPPFEAWFRSRIRSGTSFDKITNEILTAPLNGRAAMRGQIPNEDSDLDAGIIGFYTAKEGKPENLAAATSRIFLGVQLECAQCHDHPFANWSRDQFWGMAAFFAGVERKDGVLREAAGRRELLIPNTERTASATFLDDKEPEWKFKSSPRATLAAWVTSKNNSFFAKAAVNRLWSFAFGAGLVDPVDDFHEKNPPSHPELLIALAQGFVASGFDMKFVLRAICLSQTFQRDSTLSDTLQADVRLFARFPVQALTPEQLADSLTVSIGQSADMNRRRVFRDLFTVNGRTTESPTSVLQALTLMNGDLIGQSTTPGSGRALTAIVEFPGLSTAERIESLYLTALGRPPRAEELRKTVAYIERSGNASDTKTRYGDLFWILLNSIEFRTNH